MTDGVRELLQRLTKHNRNLWYLHWGKWIHSGSKRRGGSPLYEVRLALLILSPYSHTHCPVQFHPFADCLFHQIHQQADLNPDPCWVTSALSIHPCEARGQGSFCVTPQVDPAPRPIPPPPLQSAGVFGSEGTCVHLSYFFPIILNITTRAVCRPPGFFPSTGQSSPQSNPVL